MRILTANINNFGPFGKKSEERLDFSNGHFRLVYGRNEAGKSSLLEFVRNVMFGAEKDRGLYSESGRNEVGGSIEFELRDGTRGSIERTWLATSGKEKFFSARLGVRSLAEEELIGLCYGSADRSLFANFFGFSQQTLAQGGRALRSSDLKPLLYGMLFGSVDFDAVRSAMDKRLDEAFSKSKHAKNPTINRAVANLKAANRRGEEFRKSEARGRLESERVRVSSEIALANDEKRSLQAAIDALDKDLRARKIFEKRAEIERRIEDFLAVSPYERESYEAFDSERALERSRLIESEERYRLELEELERKLVEATAELDGLDKSRAPELIEWRLEIEKLGKDASAYATTRDDLARERLEETESRRELIVALVKRGVLAESASEAEIAAAFAAYSSPLPDRLRERVLELTEEESRAREESRSAKESLAAKERELGTRRAELQIALDALARTGSADRDRDADARRVDFVERDFSGLEAAIVSFDKDFDLLEKKRTDAALAARELFLAVGGAEPDDDPFALARELDAGAEPLPERLDALREKEVRLERGLVKVRERLASLRDEIATLESSDERDVEKIVDELEAALESRAVAWLAVRTAFLEDAPIPREEREALVETFESADARVDRARDNRESAYRRVVEREKKLELLAKRKEELASAENDERQGVELLSAFREKVANFWRERGFARCAGTRVEEGARWLAERRKWKEQTKALAETELELSSRARELAGKLSERVDALRSWGLDDLDDFGDFGDATDLSESRDALTREVGRVKTALSLALARAEEYRVARASVEAARKEVAKAEVEVRAERSRLAKREEELARLSSADDFCKLWNLEVSEFGKSSFARLKGELDARATWLDRLESLRRLSAKIVAREARQADFQTRATELARALEREARSDALEVDVAIWEEDLKKALAVERDFEKEALERDRLEAERSAKEAKRLELDARLAELERAAGVPREEFERFAESAATFRAARLELDAETRTLEALARGEGIDFDRMVARLGTVDFERTSEELAEKRANLEEVEEGLAESLQKKGSLESEIRALEREEGANEAAMTREGARSALRAAIDAYVPLLFARDALKAAIDSRENDQIPGVLEDASNIYSRVTAGRYERIVPDSELGASAGGSDSFRVRDARTRQLKTPEQLSVGAREQLYLALRIAHIKSYCENTEPLPILADDVVANFDYKRVERTLEELRDYATPERQVILLTCRRDVFQAFVKLFGKEYATILR